MQPVVAELARQMEAALPPLTDEHRHLGRTLTHVLAEGEPVGTALLGASVGRPEAEVAEDLAGLPFVYRDEEHRVVGFAGLALPELTKTPHRLGLDGRELFAWCAWDTLFLPIVLDQKARVSSTCPTTGEPIALTVSPVGVSELHPSGAMLSLLRPPDEGFLNADVIQRFCHFVHFFASEPACQTWIDGHEGTFQVSIAGGFELARFWAAHFFGVGPAVAAPA